MFSEPRAPAQWPQKTATIAPPKGSGFTLVSTAARPALIPRFAELSAPVWPDFIDGDEAVIRYWDALFGEKLARYQFVALHVDENGVEEVVATSNAIPFFWPTPDDDNSLPDDGWDEMMRLGVEGAAAGIKPNALSALSIVVAPAWRGSDLAGRLLLNMKAVARAEGFSALVAPVRPTRKPDYPLTSFADYVGWMRPDGTPFDPWVRKHVQLGAKIVKIAPRGMVVSAPLTVWTEWTGLRFPVSGAYHLPGGLAPMHADLEAGRGLYEEPALWLRHPL